MEIPRIFLLCLAIAPGPAVLQAGEGGAALAQTIDDVITTQRFLDDIPGATVAVVQGGRVLHVRGYGLADRAQQLPVDAGRTLFGTGSVAKVFTWTAVMQLVEQGRLLLDRDINDYLGDFQVPASWPAPVTLADLMTHTAGFEDRNIGFYARDPADLLPLGAFLARHMPARVYPPGTVSAYSNYGAALAGHIVATVSGMPFEQYIERHILAPLGMQHSSFRQPLPAALAAGEAVGYRGREGHAGRSWYQARPSGALRATAADMARFMIAHLQRGRLGETRIFSTDTAAAMQQRQFSNHPAVNGLTYGFQELTRNGLRVLWQRGDTLYFTAGMFLVPELDLGVFVACNRARVGHAPLELLDAILAQLQPPRPIPRPRLPVAGATATDRLTGAYRTTRSN
ncbi:MAG: serine hydrolase domain-containing protein, partial [Thiohalobacterales bacterium]|nr:serine hydrolase domain-containing protein [Thiohalobacterales bacterium]